MCVNDVSYHWTRMSQHTHTHTRTQVRRVVSSTMSWLNVSDDDDEEEEEEKKKTMKKKKRSRKGRARQSVSPAKCMKILEFLLGGDGAYGARERFLESESGSKLCECLFKSTMDQIRDQMLVLIGNDDDTTTSDAESSTLLLRALLLHCRMVLHESIENVDEAKSKTLLGDTPKRLHEVYRAVTEDVASILLQSKKAMMKSEISKSTTTSSDDVSSPPRARRRAKANDTTKETLRRRHQISNARALGWNVVSSVCWYHHITLPYPFSRNTRRQHTQQVLTVASECVSLGFGDGPDASDVKAWAKALRTSGGLFAPIVMERLGDLAMSLYRRSRYQADLASNGNLVLQSLLESTGPEKLKDAVSKEIRRCVKTILRDQVKRSKGLETVIPVILGPVIDAARKHDEDEESDDEEEENKNLTTYRLLCNMLCSKDSYTRVSIKIVMDLLNQGTNLDESTTVALLRLLKSFTDSSEMLTKIFAMDLRRVVKRLEQFGDENKNFVAVEESKLSTFDKVPVPTAFEDAKHNESVADDWEDTPIGMAVSSLRENLSRLSVGGTTVMGGTPLVK